MPMLSAEAERATTFACEAAHTYLKEAADSAVKIFGPDYCQRNPTFYAAVVAAFVAACSADCQQAISVMCLESDGDQRQ